MGDKLTISVIMRLQTSSRGKELDQEITKQVELNGYRSNDTQISQVTGKVSSEMYSELMKTAKELEK